VVESVTFTFGVIFGDRLRGRLTVCYFIATLAATCLIFTAAFVMRNISAMLTLAFFIGAFVGVGNTCVYAVSEEVMRIHGSIGFPSTKMMAAVGLFLAPQFSGFMIDAFGFQKFFICQGILTGCRCVLQVAILFILHRKQALSPENGKETENVSKPIPSVTFTPPSNETQIPPPPPYEREIDGALFPKRDLLA
jgi:MFS family permease